MLIFAATMVEETRGDDVLIRRTRHRHSESLRRCVDGDGGVAGSYHDRLAPRLAFVTSFRNIDLKRKPTSMEAR